MLNIESNTQVEDGKRWWVTHNWCKMMNHKSFILFKKKQTPKEVLFVTKFHTHKSFENFFEPKKKRQQILNLLVTTVKLNLNCPSTNGLQRNDQILFLLLFLLLISASSELVVLSSKVSNFNRLLSLAYKIIIVIMVIIFYRWYYPATGESI